MEDYCKLLLQVPIVLTLSSQADFARLEIFTCSKNKELHWRWISGCSRQIKGRNKNSIKQKSREQRLRSCPEAGFPVCTLDHTLKVVCQDPPLHILHQPALTTSLPERWGQGSWNGGWGCPWALRFRPVFFFTLHRFKFHAEGVWSGEEGGGVKVGSGILSIPRHLHIIGRQGKAVAGQTLASCCGERSGKRSEKSCSRGGRRRPEQLVGGQLFFPLRPILFLFCCMRLQCGKVEPGDGSPHLEHQATS